MANLSLVFATLRASSNLIVVWSARIPLLMLGAGAWTIGMLYLWIRSLSLRPPRYWYATPLLWSVVALAIATHVPQTLRFRLQGDEPLTTYVDANTVDRGTTREINTEIGGYPILSLERVGDVLVFHAEPEIDRILDHTTCAALVRLTPDDLDVWRPVLERWSARHLSDDWWLFNFSTRGIPTCQLLLSQTYPQS